MIRFILPKIKQLKDNSHKYHPLTTVIAVIKGKTKTLTNKWNNQRRFQEGTGRCRHPQYKAPPPAKN